MKKRITIRNNKELLRFEVALHGESGFINYRGGKAYIAFMNAILPETFKGNGAGSKIAHAALEYASPKT